MKKLILTTAIGSLSMALAACDSGDTTTTTDTAEPAATETGSYEAPADTMAPPADSADDDGTSLSVSPDGAQLDVNDDGTDVSVDTEDPSLQVDTGE